LDLFSGGNLFFAHSMLTKKMAFELIILGWRPAWKNLWLELNVDYSGDENEDHAPYFRSMFFLLRILFFEFNVYNINHAEREEGEE
jgi:hypothetical protein